MGEWRARTSRRLACGHHHIVGWMQLQDNCSGLGWGGGGGDWECHMGPQGGRGRGHRGSNIRLHQILTFTEASVATRQGRVPRGQGHAGPGPLARQSCHRARAVRCVWSEAPLPDGDRGGGGGWGGARRVSGAFPARGGRLQPVLMRPTPQLSFKTRGGRSWGGVQPGVGGGGSSRGSGGGCSCRGSGGGCSCRGSGGGLAGGHGGVQPGVRGGGWLGLGLRSPSWWNQSWFYNPL